mmetsp:Transcript_37001/g.57315  ORF Transcript_37001/g.57315 Transcript_37001/m.57315 type:complete len:274 (+) Transcript_37001:127-948(+)
MHTLSYQEIGDSSRIPVFLLLVFLCGFAVPGYIVTFIFLTYPDQAFAIIMKQSRRIQTCASLQQFVASCTLAWSAWQRSTANGLSMVMLQTYAFSLLARASTTLIPLRQIVDTLSAVVCLAIWVVARRSYRSTFSTEVQSFIVPLLSTGILSLCFDYVTDWWAQSPNLYESMAELAYQWAHWMDGIAIIAQCRLLAIERGGEWFIILFMVQMFLARATLSSAWLAALLDGDLRRAVGVGKLVASCWCNLLHIGSILFVASFGWPRRRGLFLKL